MPERIGREEVDMALAVRGAEKWPRGQSRSREMFYRHDNTFVSSEE